MFYFSFLRAPRVNFRVEAKFVNKIDEQLNDLSFLTEAHM